MARLRFNLRTVFVLATVLIAFFGYSQWRRRQILQASEELHKFGYVVDLPNDWHDHIWQSQPEAESFFRRNTDFLLLDVEMESDESSPIHSLVVIGFTPAVIREMKSERPLMVTEGLIERMEQKWALLTPSERTSELQSRYMTLLKYAGFNAAEIESIERRNLDAHTK